MTEKWRLEEWEHERFRLFQLFKKRRVREDIGDLLFMMLMQIDKRLEEMQKDPIS